MNQYTPDIIERMRTIQTIENTNSVDTTKNKRVPTI